MKNQKQSNSKPTKARDLNIKLARTGIEQPYLKDRPWFIDNHREYERIANFNPMLAEELEKQEQEG